MAEEVKRSLKVQFSATGQAKLAADVDKVDKGLTKAGKDGTKALGDLDNGLGELSKGLAEALDPLDKAFAATDKLFSIFGKATAVIGVAVAAYEGIKWALEAFRGSSDAAAASAEEQKKQVDALTEAIDKYSGALNTAQVREIVRSDTARQAALKETVARMQELTALEAQRDKTRTDSIAAAHALADAEAQVGDAYDGSLDDLAFQAEAYERLTADIAAAEEKHEEARQTLQRTTNTLAAMTEEAQRAADALATPFGPDEDPGSVTGGPARMAAGVDELAAALAKLDEGPVARAFEALRDLAGGAAAQRLAGFSSVFDDYAAAVQRAANVMGVLGEQTAMFFETQKSASAALDTATGLVDAHGQALAATAYEAIIAGDSFEQFLNAVAKRATAEAAIEAALYAAKALAALGVGLFTGSPQAFAAADAFGTAAAAFGAVAAVAGAVAGSTGGLAAGGGGAGGGGASGADGLQGAPAQSGPVVVNVNFSGPSSGLGRFLADELNEEGRRMGGSRLNSNVVRR